MQKPEAQLWLPCSKISMKTDFENFAFHFNVEEGEPGTYTIQATPENFDRIADVVHRGRYYHSPYVRQATPPSPPPEKKDPQRKPKKKAPLPPPKKQPSPTEDQEDDLFVVRDGYLMLFQNPGDRDPILKLFHADCITNPDPTAREFVIRHMPGTPDEETYVFGFMTDEIYEGWYKKLKANGFLDRKEDSGNIKANQVGVVSKNTLELYRYYGTPGAKPVLQMHADRCSATASRERREIRIIHTTPAGKRERITLDCATVAEFDRWNVALEFGGFLKAQEGDAGNQPRYANLNKYVFPVNLFEEDTGNRRTALSIKGGAICFYPSPDAAEPIMKILAQDSQVQYFIAQRKIRVYVNRNTDAEERVDFILALAKDYDRYSAECAKQHFPDADAKPKGTSTKPFVLCKKNLMAVYKNKHQKTPEIVIERASYEVASFPGRVLVFRPNNDLPKAKLFSCPERTVTIPDDEQMRKWSFCLKLVGFRSFCDTPPPRFFFPQVIYGFIAEEASELRTDLGRGNLIGGLFGVSPLKGSLQKPKDQELASPASSFAPAAQED